MMVNGWDIVRMEFPALHRGTYLDTACHGLTANDTARAINEKFLHVMRFSPGSSATQDTLSVRRGLDFARQEVSTLLQAHEEEIALMENSTTAMETLIRMMEVEPGDEILFCDMEFFGLTIPWKGTAGKITLFPNRQGSFTIQDIERAISPRTRFLVMSGVQEITGFKAPLKEISRLLRTKNIHFFVDATQLIGSQAFYPGELDLDFVFSSGFKWLNSPFGMGFLWMNRRKVHTFPSCRWGYFNLQEPREGWGEYLAHPHTDACFQGEPVSGALRYENGGTGNYGGAYALGAAVKMINTLGIEEIGKRNGELQEAVRTGLSRTHLCPYPFPRENRSAIVTATYGDIERDQALYRYLLERGIKISLRYAAGEGGLRIAPHFYNNEEDIERLLQAVENFEDYHGLPMSFKDRGSSMR